MGAFISVIEQNLNNLNGNLIEGLSDDEKYIEVKVEAFNWWHKQNGYPWDFFGIAAQYKYLFPSKSKFKIMGFDKTFQVRYVTGSLSNNICYVYIYQDWNKGSINDADVTYKSFAGALNKWVKVSHKIRVDNPDYVNLQQLLGEAKDGVTTINKSVEDVKTKQKTATLLTGNLSKTMNSLNDGKDSLKALTDTVTGYVEESQENSELAKKAALDAVRNKNSSKDYSDGAQKAYEESRLYSDKSLGEFQDAKSSADGAEVARNQTENTRDQTSTVAMADAGLGSAETAHTTDQVTSELLDETKDPEKFTNIEGYDNMSVGKKLHDLAVKNLEVTEKKRMYNKLFQTSELLAQKDTVMNNILMDYMINDKEGTNINKLYNRIDQNNTDKLRKININNYYTKTYQEYINMVKIIIVMALILVPILILNHNYMLPHNVTMFLVVTVIFLGVLYLGYRFYNLQMRDDKDFDKIRVPYDRPAVELSKDGKMKNKPNILNSLGITCIGDECCDASMVYDNLRNKCIMQENFGNAFETMNANQGQITYVKPCDLHEPLSNYSSYEGFVNTNSDKEGLKVELLTGSLAKSSKDKFTKFPQDFSRIE